MNHAPESSRILRLAVVILRVALSAAFLTSIGDRFGIWGPLGTRGVSWGDWTHFAQYVAVLNPYVPKALTTSLGVVETIVETALALALLIGIYPRAIAWLSAVLLATFAATMSAALGVLTPLGYGVFTAAAAAFLLGAIANTGAWRA